MEIFVPSGKEQVAVRLPDENVMGFYHPNPVRSASERDTMLWALEPPVNSTSFLDFRFIFGPFYETFRDRIHIQDAHEDREMEGSIMVPMVQQAA